MIRCSISFRNADSDYTSLNNAFLKDKNLKPATIGILAVVLSNKEDWRVFPQEIAKRLGISRKTVDTNFKLLEKHGYLKTVKHSLGRGKGVEVERFFFDKPISDEAFELWLEKFSTG